MLQGFSILAGWSSKRTIEQSNDCSIQEAILLAIYDNGARGGHLGGLEESLTWLVKQRQEGHTCCDLQHQHSCGSTYQNKFNTVRLSGYNAP